MDGNILVTPEELLKCASEFSAAGNTMYQMSSEMLQTVRYLNAVWGGSAANTYIGNFARFDENFYNLKAVVDVHARALTDMANTYQQAELRNVEIASDFKGNVLE